MTIPRDMRPLARLAGSEGWAIARCGSGHLAWRSPAGDLVVSSGSPGDWRAIHKLRADLRRHGLARAQERPSTDATPFPATDNPHTALGDHESLRQYARSRGGSGNA